MKNRKSIRWITAILLLFIVSIAQAQDPGKIVRRSANTNILDPNNDGWVSLPLNSKFTTNDVTQSEIAFRSVPLPFSEPIGDLATGQSGSFTDLVVSSLDNSGLMAYYDGQHLVFRLRVGGISAGAKAYSVLIDADFKAGNSSNSSQPDPNYVAPTATGTGNIGFEWEVLLATGNSTSVLLNNVDGKTNSTIVPVSVPPSEIGWQISRALSNNSNNADYFYDFYVPLSAFTGTYAITSSTKFRMVATTVNSPTSALAGSRSDIWGADDRNYSSTPEEWYEVLGRTPPMTLTQLNTGSIGGICSNPPVITSSSVTIGTGNSVSGTWTRGSASMDDKATITVYRYSAAGTLLNTYTSTSAYPTGVNTGSSWTLTGITAAAGDYIIAKAKGTSVSLNESECMQSNTVYATCTSAPAAPVITCASTKGISGTIPSGATIEIYQINTTNASTTATPLTTNLIYTNNASDRTFNYYGANPTTGSACGGNTGIFTAGTTLMFITNSNGCKSAPVYGCITGSNVNSSLSAISSNDLVISTPLYPSAEVSGTTTAGFTAGQVLRLFVNDNSVAGYTVSSSTNNFSFSGVSFKAGDVLKVMRQTSGSCASYSASVTAVCYNQPPIITTDANGNLLAGITTISGTSGANASITLNKTNATTNSWTTTANSSGAWSVSVPALVAGDTYTATVTSTTGCATASLASTTATVASVTTNCPTITGSYTDADGTVNGTVNVTAAGSIVRLYVDGSLVGSQTLNTIGSNQSWSISSSQPFYNGAVLKATFQSGANGSEKTDCSTTTVTCASPATPGISVTPSTTIAAGNSVTFNVSNVALNSWYAVTDASANTYATSVYTNNTSNFSMATQTFSQAGTYNLLVTADKLSGCPASSASQSIVVTSVLPVRFLNVNATKDGSKVKVQWEVTDEVNVDRYIVERSLDGRQFSSIGEVEYRSELNPVKRYEFLDPTHVNSKTYYRIRQVDINGKFNYSSIVSVKADHEFSVQVAPNPAKETTVVYITSPKSGKASLQIVDMNGNIMMTKTINILHGSNAIPVTELGRFARNNYVVKIVAGDAIHHQKLVLQ